MDGSKRFETKAARVHCRRVIDHHHFFVDAVGDVRDVLRGLGFIAAADVVIPGPGFHFIGDVVVGTHLAAYRRMAADYYWRDRRCLVVGSWVITTLPVITMLVITGVFLLLEARALDRQHGLGRRSLGNWLQRSWRYILAVGVPLLVFLMVSVYYLPKMLQRVDDGSRSARQIQGNGVTLVWAPQGPGWNWKQPDGGYPTWSRVALYGLPPIGFEVKPGFEETYPRANDMTAAGLCSYLSADGTTLMESPQHIWRLPTADEIVRSLVKHGGSAGCLWDGEPGKADCELTPDKETPLWAPDASPIYYWAFDEFDHVNAWYVSYDGSVYFQPKEWSNSRHSYRCVRQP